MLLAVDVGNTQTVFGLFDGASLTEHWRIATERNRSGDELSVLYRGFLDLGRVDGIVLSSTVPQLSRSYQEIARDQVLFQAMQGAIGQIASTAYENGSMTSPLGVLAATHANGILDRLSGVLSISLITMPSALRSRWYMADRIWRSTSLVAESGPCRSVS